MTCAHPPGRVACPRCHSFRAVGGAKDEPDTLELVRRLERLLADPHPGLFTWQMHRNEAGAALRDRLNELMPRSDPRLSIDT